MEPVTSWDFFDTLLGRSTGREPWRLFDRLGGESWREIRQRAERERAGPGFEAIWKRLQELDACQGLCSGHEWQLECDAAFPIVENVRRVGPNDVIVSDTYFTEGQVRHLARKIGIPDSVRIFASVDGKWNGWVWKTIGELPRLHVGDNRKADVESPRKAGIRSEHFRSCEWVSNERKMVAHGFPEAAAAMRTARLQNPYQFGSKEHATWKAQAGGNVGFLWLAAAAVAGHMADVGARRVLFASRDALALGRVFARLYPDIESGPFWGSRQTFRHPSPGFVRYVRDVVDPETMIVDIHGTGSSAAEFRRLTGVSVPLVMVVGLFAATRRGHMAAAQLCEAKTIRDGEGCEVANYDLAGRVIDVVNGEPVRAEIEFDTTLVEVAHQAIATAIRTACFPCQRPTDRVLSWAAGLAAEGASRTVWSQHVKHHPTAEPQPCQQVS